MPPSARDLLSLDPAASPACQAAVSSVSSGWCFFWANLAAAGVELQVCGSSHDIRVDDRRRVGERTEASSERESAQAGSPFLPLSSNTT